MSSRPSWPPREPRWVATADPSPASGQSPAIGPLWLYLLDLAADRGITPDAALLSLCAYGLGRGLARRWGLPPTVVAVLAAGLGSAS